MSNSCGGHGWDKGPALVELKIKWELLKYIITQILCKLISSRAALKPFGSTSHLHFIWYPEFDPKSNR